MVVCEPPAEFTQGTVTSAEPPTLKPSLAMELDCTLHELKCASALPQNCTVPLLVLSKPSMQAGPPLVYVATPRTLIVVALDVNNCVKKRGWVSARRTSTDRASACEPDVGGV